MSSHIRKLQTRVELKRENEWLRNAFRNAVAAFTEQQENGAALARALWVAAEQNGGQLRVKQSVLATRPDGASLRAYDDPDTSETVFVAHVAEPQPEVPAAEETGVKEAAEKLIVEHGPALDYLSDR